MTVDHSVNAGLPPGELVAHFRRRAALTQNELARLSGLSIRTMRDLEHGRVLRPRKVSLDRLAGPLRLSDAERAQLDHVFRQPPEARSAQNVRVGILGSVCAERGRRTLPLGQPLQRTLFALLALRRNGFVGTDEAVDVLWGDHAPRTCLRQLQAMAGRLRHLLHVDEPSHVDGAVVRRLPHGYRLDIDDDHIDAGRFERLLAVARRPMPQVDPAADWRAAIDCWRGPVVADTSDRLRLHPAALALERRRVDAVLHYADAASAAGQAHDAVDALQELARAERLHEGVQARLVIELARTGDRAAALRHYEMVRRQLAEELRVAPGDQLRRAYRVVVGAEHAEE